MMTEGDVFRWSYRDQNADNRAYGSYHCCSRMAIVHNGRLRDTYWQVGQHFSDCRSFGADDLHKIELTRLGNLSDLEKAPEYQGQYYDEADIVDLNHANSTSGNFYLRKGAVRSQKKMLKVARDKLEQKLSDRRYAEQEAERLRVAISKIEAGEIDFYL